VRTSGRQNPSSLTHIQSLPGGQLRLDILTIELRFADYPIIALACRRALGRLQRACRFNAIRKGIDEIHGSLLSSPVTYFFLRDFFFFLLAARILSTRLGRLRPAFFADRLAAAFFFEESFFDFLPAFLRGFAFFHGGLRAI
jgi:hypothetical protein